MGDVRYIPPAQWNTLPVQPPAGLWHRRSRPWMVAILATVAVIVLATLLIVAFRAQAVAWTIWIPIAFIFIEGAPLLVFSLKASVPYSRERKLGYTTWPDSRRK